MPPAQTDIVELSSSRLRLVVALPGKNYNSTRFDWSSFATSLILDGKHEFVSAEHLPDSPKYADGGKGLCCEFGIKSPIGYSDCPIGEWFPKIGVGMIRRETAADYNFFHHYQELRPLEYSFSYELPPDIAAPAEVFTITGRCDSYRGYGWTMSRSWIVRGISVENRCSLYNTGILPLRCDEYSHNFIRLGPDTIGPDTKLHFGFPIADSAPDCFDPSHCLDGRRPVFRAVPEREFYLGGLLANPIDDAWWQASNSNSGLSLREDLDSQCIKCDCWGKSSVISCELFTPINVAPGKSYSWKRNYQVLAG